MLYGLTNDKGEILRVVEAEARTAEERELERRERATLPGHDGYADRDKPIHFALVWGPPSWTVHPESRVGVA